MFVDMEIKNFCMLTFLNYFLVWYSSLKISSFVFSPCFTQKRFKKKGGWKLQDILNDSRVLQKCATVSPWSFIAGDTDIMHIEIYQHVIQTLCTSTFISKEAQTRWLDGKAKDIWSLSCMVTTQHFSSSNIIFSFWHTLADHLQESRYHQTSIFPVTI